MKLLSAAAVILPLILIDAEVEASKGVADMCWACYDLSDHVQARLKATEHRAGEPIEIGIRLDGSGANTPKKTIPYGESNKRFLDIFENACSGNSKVGQCTELLFKYDDEINEWFRSGRQPSFKESICHKYIKNCDDATVEYAKTSDVEISEDGVDERKGAPVVPPKEDPRKESVKTGESATKKESESSRDAASAGDVLAIVKKVVGRVKGNATKAYELGLALSREISVAYKTGNWTKLKNDICSPEFYRKNYILFLFTFIILYLVYSIWETISGSAPKAAPSRRGQARELRSASPNKSRSTGRAGSKKD